VKRASAFAIILLITAFTLYAAAQPRRPAPKPAAADAAAREERDAGAPKAGAIVEAKDGGAKVFRFGEVEVEGRLKSPQIVYFLRRVRAEFAAGDLGHRSFMRELDESKNEPSF
jgi:hypothetical protein